VEKNKETSFEKFTNMIDKKAWEVSKSTGVEFEELQAQGALIYLYCLNKFDVSKASFSTFLCLSLNRLYEFAYYFRDRNRDDTLSEIAENSLESRKNNPTLKEVLEAAKETLTEDGYRLIDWILNRSWDFQGKNKPCLAMAMRNFGWNRDYSKSVWNECKIWWNKVGKTLYK